MEPLSVELLGRFRLRVGGRTLDDSAFRLRRAGAVVKLLALAPEHQLGREELCDLLWPELPAPSATGNLRYALHMARRSLAALDPSAPGWLGRAGQTVVLDPPGGLRTDVGAFQDAVAAARSVAELDAYRRALGLYRGDLLPLDRAEEWSAEAREALRGQYLAALAELAELHEARGELEPAIATWSRIASLDLARESAHAALMRLYAETGDRPRALRQYRRLREVLQRELGVEPDPETERLRRDILARRHPTTRLRPSHNLPSPLTSFVGRRREMAELRALLADARLLTLTGPGGIGKTRLALAVAADLAAGYPHGAWLVELAGLADPALVPRAVASTLGVPEAAGRPLLEMLAAALRHRSLLLVLDNCEHLAAAYGALSEALLRACPGLRILATSRHALDVAGEVVWPVPPLSPDGPGLEADAVRLFVERARLSRAEFALTDENAAVVAQVCRRLDGLPLAIELAASRLRVLSVEQIAARLDASFELLTGGGSTTLPRHRTLRGVVDWSHALLTPPEQELFARLSVFAGGFTLEAAQAIGGEVVLDTLSRLVDKSLVVAELRGGAVRYRLLETLRLYARERLAASADAEETPRRHAAYFEGVAAEAEPHLKGPAGPTWLDRLEREHDNLRAALAWCAVHDPTMGLRLAYELWELWDARSHFAEGRRWLDRLLAVSPEPTAERARGLYAAGNLALRQGDRPVARRLYEESLVLCRRVGERWYTARALESLGWMAHEDGDRDQEELLDESVRLFEEIGGVAARWQILGTQARRALTLGDREGARAAHEELLALSPKHPHERGMAANFCHLANVIRTGGAHPRAVPLLQEGLARYRRMGDKFGIGFALLSMADASRQLGECDRATQLFAESADVLREIGSQHMLAECLALRGVLAIDRREHLRGVEWIAAGSAALGGEQPGALPLQFEHSDCAAALAAARGAVGDAAFADAWAVGRALDLDRAIERVFPHRDATSVHS